MRKQFTNACTRDKLIVKIRLNETWKGKLCQRRQRVYYLYNINTDIVTGRVQAITTLYDSDVYEKSEHKVVVRFIHVQINFGANRNSLLFLIIIKIKKNHIKLLLQ